ncbi:rhodanese-like domain-containing protein [Acinetobacter apis]|uniref:Thiosulfate/3-mercaptopyruvate sulfurtransferase n=1 Tax=Acinetobacter apis TaxID=1229165 RepID=A0A217EH06_9GAMM|nr:sulfurtransferase [Acinetobacter apis]SNQ29602.1 thiosulfate/3-mercaptopyruvate sulfurtransferase [Acinetobacter apis]
MAISDLTSSLLIEAEDLVPYLGHPQLRIVDLTRASVYEQLHIPHAIHVQPKQLVKQQELASGLLPDHEKLQQLIAALGLSPEHHVVAYDDEGGAWASRFLWNLHCIGFHQTSLLNGGIHAWLGAGLPTTTEKEPIEPVSHFFPVPEKILSQYQISYHDVLQLVEKKEVQIWDCRTFDEYTGQRLAARRGGHMPNALNYEWSRALNRENHLKLHELEYIQHSLQQTGFDLAQPVVVYCQSHHRSGLAYMVGRLLNWNIRAYDGAWSEWGNMPSSPIVTGEKPL